MGGGFPLGGGHVYHRRGGRGRRRPRGRRASRAGGGACVGRRRGVGGFAPASGGAITAGSDPSSRCCWRSGGRISPATTQRSTAGSSRRLVQRAASHGRTARGRGGREAGADLPPGGGGRWRSVRPRDAGGDARFRLPEPPQGQNGPSKRGRRGCARGRAVLTPGNRVERVIRRVVQQRLALGGLDPGKCSSWTCPSTNPSMTNRALRPSGATVTLLTVGVVLSTSGLP